MSVLLRIVARSTRRVAVALSILFALASLFNTGRAAAQTPPSVSVSPGWGTHVTSPYQNIIVTACSDYPLWSAATVIVNGSYYDGYDGISAGGCGWGYSGGWIAGVTLQAGANYVDAEVCDYWGNCGWASTLVYYDPPPSYGVSVTPDGGSATAPQNAGGAVPFTITNTGNAAGTLNGSVFCSGAAYDCNVLVATTFTVSLSAGASTTVYANFSTSTAASGTIGISVSFQESPGTGDSGDATVTVTPPSLPPPAPIVTPDGQPVTVTAPGTQQLSFTVRNNSGGSQSYSLAASCGVFTSCSVSPSSVTLPLGSAQDVAVTFAVGANQNGVASTVSLSATGCNVAGCSSDGGSYAVSVNFPQPSVSVWAMSFPQTLPPGTTSGSKSFQITTANTGFARTFTLTPQCSGAAICSGQSQVTLGDNESTIVGVNYSVGAVGTSGTVTLSAVSGSLSGNDSHTFSIAPLYALSVTPTSGSQNTTVGTSGSYGATVQNTSRNTVAQISATINLQGCPSPALTTCQITPVGGPLSQGASSSATVSYVAAQVGTGTVTLTASGLVGQTLVSSDQPSQMTINVTPAPVTGAITVTPANDAISISAGAGDQTVVFTLASARSAPEQFSYTIACTAAATVCRNATGGTTGTVGPLGNGQQTTIPVTYHVTPANGSVGTITLTAQSTTDASAHASGTRTINLIAGPPVVVATRSVNAGAAIARDACVTIAAGTDAAFECGDLRLAHELPATTTMNKTRAPTLVYNSRHAAPVALVAANVTVQPGIPASQVVMEIKVKRNDAQRTLFPSIQRVFSWTAATMSDGAARRVVVPIFADSLGAKTGVYEYTMEARVQVPGSQIVVSDTGTVIIVNRIASVFGAGWWLDGLEQLVDEETPSPTQKLWIGGDGNARVYRQVGTSNVWVVNPTLDRPDTLTFESSTGVWHRHLRNGAFVEFDNTGHHVATQNMQGHRTTFGWTGSFLSQITLPAPSDPGPTYLFTPTVTNGVTTRLVVDAPQADTARRVTMDYDQSAKQWTFSGPDTTHVVITHDAWGRAITRTNRRGFVTHYAYEPGGGTLVSSTVDMPAPDANIVQTFCAAEGVGLPNDGGTPCRPGPVEAAMVHTFYNGPRTDVVDTMAFFVGVFGEPTRIVNAVGEATTIQRTSTQFPLLVTATVQANGFRTEAAYTSRGLLDSTTAIDPFERGCTDATCNAVTHFEWHQGSGKSWDRPTKVTSPNGVATNMDYDPATGVRLGQQVGPNSARRVSYAYQPATRQLVAAVEPDGPSGALPDSIGYDAMGNVSHTRTPRGILTLRFKDAIGRDSLVVTPTDTVTALDSAALYNTGGVRTWLTYDINDRVRKTRIEAPPGATPQALVVDNEYDNEGMLTRVARHSEPDAGAGTIQNQYHYDPAGRQIEAIAPDNGVDVTHYDAAGNVKSVATRRGHLLEMTYDQLNRLHTRQIPSAVYPTRTDGVYADALPRSPENRPYPRYPIGQANATTIDGDLETFEYDVFGHVTLATNADALVSRDYFHNGQLKSETQRIRSFTGNDFNTHTYTIRASYDLSGRRTALHYPTLLVSDVAGAADSVRYEYDPETGVLAWVTDPLGHRFGYEYDLRGRQKALRRPNDVDDVFTYSADDDVILHHTDNGGAHQELGAVLRDTKLAYDGRGKMLTSVNTQGKHDQLTAGYSKLGNVTSSSYADVGVNVLGDLVSYSSAETFAPDALGNVFSSSLTTSGSTVNHDEVKTGPRSARYETGLGRLRATTFDATSRDTLMYDAAGNLEFQTAAERPSTQSSIEDRASYYGADGRLRAVDRRIAARGGFLAFQRPLAFTFEDYRYDALGRRVLVRTRRWAQNRDDWNEGLISTIRRTVWDGEQELAEVQMPGSDGVTAALLENDTGTVAPQAAQVVGPAWVDLNRYLGRVLYTHGLALDAPLSVIRVGYSDVGPTEAFHRWAPMTLYPHWNTRAEADYGSLASGDVKYCETGVTRCVFPPWVFGWTAYTQQVISRDSWFGTLLESKRDGSGLLYRRARSYDPQQGRFTQEDPIGLAGGMNLYGFAGGDPVNYTDPFGLCKNAKGESVSPAECDKPIEKVTKDIEAAKIALAFLSEVGAAAEGVEAVAEISGKLTAKYGPAVKAFINETTGALQQEWINAVSGMKHVLRGPESHPLTPGGSNVTHINYEQHIPKPGKPGRFTQVQDIHLDANGRPIP